MKATDIEIAVDAAIKSRAGWKKVAVARIPTWNYKGQEGLQIESGKLVSYWIKDLAKVFDQPPSQLVQDVINEVLKIEQPKEQKTEQVTAAAGAVQVIGIVPDTLTKELIEKWQGMKTFDRLLMFQNTPDDRVKIKPGINVKYVEGNFMQQEANVAFLFNWMDSIEGFHFSDNAVACYGYVAAEIDGKIVRHSAVGVDLQEFKKADNKPVFTQEELMKNAHTDMIKKALSKFGFNGDVYRGEV